MKVGIFEKALTVPLFTELYGYGPFLGRRCRGTRDSLFCRALTFFDGNKRIVLVVTDAVVTDDADARALRAIISAKHGIAPEGVFFAGTHTHSGPAMSLGIGWGEMNQEYLEHWRNTVMEVVAEAIASEEEIRAYAGIAPLTQKIGKNRVEENGPTDTGIRWIQFKRADGTVKALLHNHGMHGVVFGSKMLFVSADWMGEANRLIKERGMAETPFFLYGAAGNVNADPVGGGETHLLRIGKSYVDDLEAGVKAGGRELNLWPLSSALEAVVLPTVHEDAAQMLENARILAPSFLSSRFEEMAILAEQGRSFEVKPDLQVLRIGDIAIYAFPGEPFCELGKWIMDESSAPFPMAAGVANGNCRYFPIQATFDKFKDGIASTNRGYGFYEIYQGAGRFMPRYQPDIARFVVDKLLAMDPLV